MVRGENKVRRDERASANRHRVGGAYEDRNDRGVRSVFGASLNLAADDARGVGGVAASECRQNGNGEKGALETGGGIHDCLSFRGAWGDDSAKANSRGRIQ